MSYDHGVWGAAHDGHVEGCRQAAAVIENGMLPALAAMGAGHTQMTGGQRVTQMIADHAALGADIREDMDKRFGPLNEAAGAAGEDSAEAKEYHAG
jgi:hypothetical protein